MAEFAMKLKKKYEEDQEEPKPNEKCSHSGCDKAAVVKVKCDKCKKNFCADHTPPDIHGCPKPKK